MNFDRVCYGCFREKSTAVCPYCGYDPVHYEHPALALPIGSILNGRYLTGVVLGMGGFGITYLGYDLTLDIKVAIKEYLPGGIATRNTDGYNMSLLSRRDEESYRTGEERFLDEARILAKLQNAPNIVSVQNYFRENNTAYFVMDYIDGMSLKAYLQSHGGSIPYEQALAILLPIMEALAQVHAQNLLHRDISPDNIYITADGQSRLLDFGAARFALGDNKSISVILKHGYAPEEQYRSHGNQGPWTDVYAMGATMYHCLTGALPPDSIERLHNDTLRPPSELGVPIPPHAEAALMRALAVKAENRFPNMTALISALAGKAAVQQSVAATVAMQASAHTSRAKEEAHTGIKGLMKKLKSNKTLLGLTIGGGILLLALIIVPIVLLTGKKQNIPSSSDTGGTTTAGPSGDTWRITPSPAATTPPPSQTPVLSQTRAYTNGSLGMTMQIPVEMLDASTDAGMILERTNYTTVLCAFGYFSGQVMYTLDDFVRNRDAIISAEMSSTDLGAWSITGGEYVTLNGNLAYRVDIQLSAEQNATFQTYAITPAEGLGLYLLHIGQKLDDPNLERHQQENEAMLQSITFHGAPTTNQVLYESLYMDIRFVYLKDYLVNGMKENPETDEYVPNICLYPNDSYNMILIEYAEGFADSIDDAFTIYENVIKNNDPDVKSGNLYTQVFGSQTYTIKDYEMHGADTGELLYCAFLVTEIEGKLYSLDIAYTEEEQSATMMQLYAILTTLGTK